MKPRFIALNLTLALALAAISWQAKVHWDESVAKRRATLRIPVKPTMVPPVMSVPKPDSALPSKYNDVAQKNLFSKDRNPQVVIEPPKEPEKPKPMPKLPVVYGVMGLPSGVKAVMAETAGGNSSVVKTGDSVGEFKVIALDTKRVTFEWNQKQVTKDIDDLIDRAGPPTGAANVAAAPAPATNAAPASGRPPEQSVSMAPAAEPGAASSVKADPSKGIDIGAGGGPSVRACAQGDNTPAGTVVDGYKKISEATPFGQACRWIKQQ